MNHYPHPYLPFPYRTDTLLENSERSELIIGKLASFASPHSGISLRLAEGQSFGDFTEPKAIVKEPNTEVASIVEDVCETTEDHCHSKNNFRYFSNVKYFSFAKCFLKITNREEYF